MRKQDIEFHSDGFGRRSNPAVDVKQRGKFGPSVSELCAKFGCDDETAEKALQLAWDSAQEQFWESAKEWADELFPGAEMYSEGRGAGWLTIHGLPDVESWDAIAVSKWARLAKWCRVEIEYLCSPAAVLDAIAANEWAKPGAEQYNFIDTKDGQTLCIADLKAQAKAAGFGPVVRP